MYPEAKLRCVVAFLIKEIINFWGRWKSLFISFCDKTEMMWRRKMLQRPDGTGGLFISCPNIMLVITLLSTYPNNIIIKLFLESKVGQFYNLEEAISGLLLFIFKIHSYQRSALILGTFLSYLASKSFIYESLTLSNT